MINVYDLHFNKEILPLFDYVHNENARSILMEILSEIPASVDEIYARQNIAKALLKHRHLYTSFSYSEIEFSQVYTYLEDKKTRPAQHRGIAQNIHFLFATAERNREKGGLYQFFYFFQKVRQFYFSKLKTEIFPEEFRGRLTNIQKMFEDLQVEKNYIIIRRGGLTTAQMVRLSQGIQEKIDKGEMDMFWKDFFTFEAWYSISWGIDEHNFKFPAFTDGPLVMTEFYHPLLQYPVRNSLAIKETVTLITGPNMSGKSTLLKSIGLCVYLAHLGLAVPAEQCELPFFEVISVAIDLNDDIKSGYSHFMTEIQILKKVVRQASQHRRSFAIFDELFRGTNIEDALAISETTIKGLAAFEGSYFFISTHLHQLEPLVREQEINACCIECQLEKGLPVFTYKLKPGWSDLKIGQIIFQQEGLDELLRNNDRGHQKNKK